MDPTRRRIGLAVAVVLIAAAIVAIEQPWDAGSTAPPAPDDLPPELADLTAAPGFQGATAWLNGGPVDLLEARRSGKIVLVDFWTYSCINCINTFPHLNAWWDTYEDDGLVIVGVHTPEFRFERDVDNIRQATERHGLDHPIAVDSDYEIWDAYRNRFWPAKYLVGPHGRIRFNWAGEGGYDRTEDAIREMLREAGHDPGPRAVVDSDRGGYRSGQTPELFATTLDDHRTHDLGNEAGYRPGENVTYTLPDRRDGDRIYLDGTWYNGDQRLVARTNASVVVAFTAGGANVVAGGADGSCVPVELDGRPIPDSLAGPDVGNGTPPCVGMDGRRAYDLYAGPFEDHQLSLEVPPGFELYTFAFSERGREGG